MVDFLKLEKRWQKKWEDSKAFKVKDNKKKKFYCLEMFPYPSGSGLHMGHAFNYTIGDIQARFKRMQGFNILYPMGYDSFGLPAENAAIKANVNPKKYTEAAIKNFIKQQKSLGLSYDWNRIVMTHTPEYYKWNQYFFLKFLENDLVYKKKAKVNWCPKCNTVLANEQVHSGKCWRHEDTGVTERELEQWFIKTTKYADELLKDIEKLEWPKRIKIMQENWIGKSEGLIEKWDVEGTNIKLETFTTWPHTTYGCTFMVIAPEHPIVQELVNGTKYEEGAKKFIEKIKKQKLETRELKDKEGFFIGKYAINYAMGLKMPIYIAGFAIMDYGTGIVKACPAHDKRDFEFAKQHNLKIIQVIKPKNGDVDINQEPYIGEGVMINAGDITGMSTEKAKEEFSIWAIKQKKARKETQYKLRDWLISRQRYWGTPIPIIYCDKCGTVPVKEKDLPVKLPDKVKFGKGNPLETNKQFVEVKCPKCKSKARRETDTMDTFFDSSWYFLRYTDNKNKKTSFDKKKAEYWMPVDQYIGGAEHACMHLIYARFFTKALRDLKFININEPFIKLFNQGMLHGDDGHVMSKSRGNVVIPEEVSKKYGIDTARLFLVSLASPDKDIAWSEKGIESSFRFVNKVIEFFEKVKIVKSSKKVQSKINSSISEITENIESFNYNIAVIKIRELFESLEEEISKEDIETFLKLLHPFCPHITEELWEKMGNKSFISLKQWPKADKSKIDLSLEYEDSLLESTIHDIREILKLVKIEQPQNISLFIAEQWKYDFMKKIKQEIEKTRDISTLIKSSLIKNYEKETAKLVPSIVKDQSKIPSSILSPEKEYELFKNNIKSLEKEFNCKISIIYSKDSNELKAKQSLPGKTSIIVNLLK
ncbi:leucine--tRNA ligase [Candidatus Woesearchaeota archaeon]|nr:leucine--tRNA ligase [Candidatus Woesearchaeota archaeon]